MPCLTSSVERSGYLGPTEGAVCEKATVITSERNTLGHSLVDDIYAHLGEAVHIALARAKVPALHGVVKKAINTVAIALVILCRVDATWAAMLCARLGES